MRGGGQSFATAKASSSSSCIGRTRSSVPSTACVVPVKDDSDVRTSIGLPVSTFNVPQHNQQEEECRRDESTKQERSTNDVGRNNPPDMVAMKAEQPVTERLLLLEGDRYHLSEHGIARSLYQIVLPSSSSSSSSCSGKRSVDIPDLGIPATICIEEFYDLAGARKSFIVRNNAEPPSGTSTGPSSGHLFLGEAIPFPPSYTASSSSSPLIFSEINGADSARAGTGSRTWDSSIVMSMYFASRPDLLYGDVIELGSGVGLGGILSSLLRKSLHPHADPLSSMTLTDYQEQVLEQCTENIAKLSCALGHHHPLSGCSRKNDRDQVRVECLDWHDFARQSGNSLAHKERYDTVLACDCAYLYPDIQALVSTMMTLPRRRPTSRIHAFGPINRGGLIRLIQELRLEPTIDVEVEVIDMVRHRLEIPSGLGKAGITDINIDPIEVVSSYAASDKASSSIIKHESKFLHVTCTFRSLPLTGNDLKLPSKSLSDID